MRLNVSIWCDQFFLQHSLNPLRQLSCNFLFTFRVDILCVVATLRGKSFRIYVCRSDGLGGSLFCGLLQPERQEKNISV